VPVEESPEITDADSSTPERDAGPGATQPEEWSPPDPAEFESVDSASGDSTEESASDAETTEWETDETDGDSPDGPRTADDLFGEGTDDEVEDISNLLSADDEESGGAADPGDLSEDGDTGGESDDETAFETGSDSDPLSDALDES